VNRRRILCLAIAGFAAGPAFAQGKVLRIGYLSTRASRTSIDDAFVAGLRDLGYAEGRNVAIEYRWAGNDMTRLRPLADELVALKVDVIVTATTAGVRAAMEATRTIPIVMAAAADPVGAGLVASLGRPGGNVTGVSLQTTDMARKRLQLALELVPGAKRIGLLAEKVVSPAHGTTATLVAETRAAVEAAGLQLTSIEVASAAGLPAAFADFGRAKAQVAIVQVSPLFLQHAARVVELAAKERLPAIYEARNFVDAGGLVSYGPDLLTTYRRAAAYVDRILKGAKPGDLPVEQPDKFALVVNLRAAQGIGFTVPQSLQVRADDVLR
jgi:putative ABC transport system substrate-binding protein